MGAWYQIRDPGRKRGIFANRTLPVNHSCVARCGVQDPPFPEGKIPCFPLGISVESPVLEIASLDLGSGPKMGLSGILGFAWNESRQVNSRGAFPTANVLVNLLIEEPVKGFPTLFTCHLSRLVSGFERGLLHRNVTDYQSIYS